MPFKKGQSGNPNGRPKGAKSKVTQEWQETAQRLLSDKAYRDKLKARLHEGSLAPVLEAKLWAHAYGEPASDDSAKGQPNILVLTADFIPLTRQDAIDAVAIASQVMPPRAPVALLVGNSGSGEPSD